MKPSKIALCQALKIVRPDISKVELFRLIDVPVCFTTTTRYFLGTYDAKPWETRSDEERTAALQYAKDMIATSPTASE